MKRFLLALKKQKEFDKKKLLLEEKQWIDKGIVYFGIAIIIFYIFTVIYLTYE